MKRALTAISQSIAYELIGKMLRLRESKHVHLLGARNPGNCIFACLFVRIPKQKPCHALLSSGTYGLQSMQAAGQDIVPDRRDRCDWGRKRRRREAPLGIPCASELTQSVAGG